MIGWISGDVILMQDDIWLIKTDQGIGYEVNVLGHLVPGLDFNGSGDKDRQEGFGGSAELFLHAVYKEDAQSLYGFETVEQREVFRLLIASQGVGPKLGMAILSAMDLASLIHALEIKNAQAFKAIKGVGPRLAEKLVVDLAPKIAKMLKSGHLSAVFTEKNRSAEQTESGVVDQKVQKVISDAILAFESLGYKGQAYIGLAKEIHTPDMSAEDLIKLMLKSIRLKASQYQS